MRYHRRRVSISAGWELGAESRDKEVEEYGAQAGALGDDREYLFWRRIIQIINIFMISDSSLNLFLVSLF